MRLENTSFGYSGKVVVRDFSIDIKKGEIICLIGPNGGGKSTVLKSIYRKIKVLGGTVYLGDRDLSAIPAGELAKEMSIVTTERIKPQLMTCMDVVMAGRLPFSGGFGLYKKEDEDIALEAMKLLKVHELRDIPYENLSDGQKQRSLIARAICQEPEILVMDEPTSYMDIRHRYELMSIVKDLSKKGITIIMSLHELELALDVADRLLLIHEDGEVTVSEPGEVVRKKLIKDLYGLDDEMYKKIEKMFADTPQ